MSRKRIRIDESRFNMLFERVSDKLWHFTQPSSVLDILRNNRVGCSFAQNRSDGFSAKHPYYICMSRTRTVYDNSWGRSKVARIQFDGYELNKYYSGRPINYYGMSKGDVQSRGSFEYEDRIFSDKPYIENADRFITRIDILYDDGYGDQSKYAKMFKEILNLSRETGIPVYFYGDKMDYSRQTDNIINDEVEGWSGMDEQEPYRKRVDFTRVLAELFSVRYVADNESNLFQTYSESFKQKIHEYLSKYGIEKYTDKVFNEFKFSNPAALLRDSVICSLANNCDFRQAHMTSQSPEDGEILQRMTIDIMKEFGESSIDRVIYKIVNGKYKKDTTSSEVRCVIKSYQGDLRGRLLLGDEKASEHVSVDRFIDSVRYCLMDDENNLDPGEDVGYDGYGRKIWHKSKSNNSLLAYLERKFDNGNCTMYEFAETLGKLFRGDYDKMKEEFGVSFKPIIITRDEFARNCQNLFQTYDGYWYGPIVDKLFGGFDEFEEYRKRNNIPII